MMRYSVVLRRDEEGNWLADVPSLPGCHTWGRSKDEAIANAKEAIEGCIESLEATGDPVPAEDQPVEIAVVSVS
jgi:predicted RNase H-like HicB family nuclease